MLIEEALYSLLSTDAGVIAIAADRIYPVTMPQLEKGKTYYPAVAFELVARERQQTHDGPTPLVRSFFTIACLGPKYFEVKTLADAVRLALNGSSAALAALYESRVRGVFLDNELDDYVFDDVEQLSLYRIPMDFHIQHDEPLTAPDVS